MATLLLLLLATASATACAMASATHVPVFAPQPLFRGPVPFDFYVLAQSWQPEFCHGKTDEYPGCQAPEPFWRTHFTLHGLWPELAAGKHPGFCGGAPFDAAALDRAIGRDVLVQFWPDVKFRVASPEYPEFWKHEWTRHGTCSGLEQLAYFGAAVDLLRNGSATTPDVVQRGVNSTVAAATLRSAFGDAAVLKCDRGGALAQVFTCWDKDAQHRPTKRRACPTHVLREDTCTGGEVFIPGFP